jgi:thiamine biosynthesis lipoprotein
MELHSDMFEAIGVLNLVTVTEPAALGPALEAVRAEVAAIDAACSRFHPDSELSRLNRANGEPFLVEALGVALRATEATDGAVDPTVGASLRALGWDRDFALVATGRASFRLVPAAGRNAVRLDPVRRVVRTAPGVELDLGATAKALAADRAARAAAAAARSPVLVSLGGDVAVAGAPPGGWAIRVTDDHRDSVTAHGQTVAIRDGGLATSSTTVRRWRAGDTDVHHIVDPRTGVPVAEHWRTVTVAASTCVGANTAATAALVRGRDALSWLEALRLPARLVRRDGSVAATSTWPAPA